jgi:hypothetical protein
MVDLWNVKEQMSFYLMYKNTYFRTASGITDFLFQFRVEASVDSIRNEKSKSEISIRYRGRVARLSSAKAPTAVRICSVPPASRFCRDIFFIMLKKEDEDFIRYWSQQRLRKMSFFWKASLGLPLGVLIVIGLGVSMVAAMFHRKANPILQNESSLVIVVMLAGLGIVFFITYFSAQHKKDLNELHYQELLKKKEEESKQRTAEK